MTKNEALAVLHAVLDFRRVIGIFHGQDRDLEGAKKIYGSSFVRIQNVSQLADTAGELIRREMDKMK